MERGEEQRQRGLGDARVGAADLVGERAELLALGELAREDVKHRSVHDDWRNRPVPPRSV